MNFFELDISYFRSNENLLVGFFHGILLSLPFSVPFFVCLRYFLFHGIHIGMSAFFGILFGQISFLSLMSLGYRPLIQFWYTSEPFLAFLGMSLLLKLATDFYHQKVSLLSGETAIFTLPVSGNINTPELGMGAAPSPKSLLSFLWRIWTKPSNMAAPRQVFLLNFCLMFLNPIFPATASRLLLSQDILVHFGIVYILGFICGSFGILLSFVFLLKGAASIWQVTRRRGSESVNGFFLNKFLSFCIIGSLLLGSIQYTWRLVTQYPMEFLPSMSSGYVYSAESQAVQPMVTEFGQSPMSQSQNMSEALKNQVSALPNIKSEGKIAKIFQREFPSFDSNIRHREKNLPVDRHLPIERINARRTLSGRPPLNEEQKSDAYLKYNSFFLNKIEEILDDAKIKYRTNLRTSSSDISYETIRQLQKIKERYAGWKSFASQSAHSPTQDPTQYTAPLESKKLQNNTKGKPKFSYIRELFENTQKPPYLHDDLHVYQAIFRQIFPSP